MRIKDRLKGFGTLALVWKIFNFTKTVWNVIDSMLNLESLAERGILGAVLVFGSAAVLTGTVQVLSDRVKLKLIKYLAKHLNSNQIIPSVETDRTELIGA